MVSDAHEVADRHPDGLFAVECDLEHGRAEGLHPVVGAELEAQLADRAAALDLERFARAGSQLGAEVDARQFHVHGVVVVVTHLVLHLVDQGLVLGELARCECDDAGLRAVCAVVDIVVNHFVARPQLAVIVLMDLLALVSDLAALAVGDREVEVVAALAVRGQFRHGRGQRGADELVAAQDAERGAFDGRRVAAVEVDAQRAVAAVIAGEGHPEADDRTRTLFLGIHHYELGTAVGGLDADELVGIGIAEPARRPFLGRYAVIAAELFAGVGGRREARERVAVDHLLEQGLDRHGALCQRSAHRQDGSRSGHQKGFDSFHLG